VVNTGACRSSTLAMCSQPRPLSIFLISALTFGVTRAADIEIDLAHDSEKERQTKVQLEQVLSRYQVDKWLFTRKVRIDETVIPHSHPTLTLNTGNLGQDERLLSEFVHEQIHWLEEGKPEQRDAAIGELEKLFPDLPTRAPQGARDRRSSYLHLVVCYQEFQAMKELVGDTKAKEVFDYWAGHHYKAIYRAVLEREDTIGPVVNRNQLQIPDKP
jgi:hypothetical protein